jgi:hypothetical protein
MGVVKKSVSAFDEVLQKLCIVCEKSDNYLPLQPLTPYQTFQTNLNTKPTTIDYSWRAEN